MSTVIYTGRRIDLSETLIRDAGELLRRDDTGSIFVVVPNQLTLETELRLLGALGLKGSFRLSVVSPKRLCSRVFEECGRPASSVIDERGRAMLMAYILRQHEKELECYGKTASRAGFETRLVEEIARFRQANVTSDELKNLIDGSMDDRLRAKITDLSLIYADYEARISETMQDGEEEIHEAVKRMGESGTLKNASALIYGFDITTSSVNELIAGLAAYCPNTRVFIPLPNEGEGDGSIYEPLKKALGRMMQTLREESLPYTLTPLSPSGALTPLQKVMRRLYVPNAQKGKPDCDITAAQLKNPLDEARYVAASIRQLVRTRGYSYSDIIVIAQALESCENSIACAFTEYAVPYFTQTSMSASAHPLCRYLLETLALISGTAQSVSALSETGLGCLSPEEQEILADYCERLKLRPSAMLKPFTRGSFEMIEAAEPVRQKLTEQITALREKLRAAHTLGEQMTDLSVYLESCGCFQRYADYVDALKASGEAALAQDAVRMSNLLFDTFDQMNELLGPKPLALSALSDLIGRALDTAVVKVLPQSPDAVQITSPQRCGLRPVKAVFLMHAVSMDGVEEAGIFEETELTLLSRKTGKYLAPSPVDLARTDRMYLKDALCQASESVRVSFPSGAMDGSALMSGSIISELKRLLTGFRVEGGVEGNESADILRLSSPIGALNRISSDFTNLKEDAPTVTALRLMERSGTLSHLRRAALYSNRSQPLDREIARQLYNRGTSVSRLEKYAACPFSHFVEQGLRPQKERAFAIDPLNRGTLLHECVELFMKSKGIEDGSEQEAAKHMEEIFDEALKGELRPYVLDSHAAMFQVKTLRRAASRAATLLYRQLKAGVFHPVDVEIGFGPEGRKYLRLNENVHLDGRIDRVDLGVHEGERYVFVVDYKSGFKSLEPKQIKAGLQLQLLIYLAVAMHNYSARSAGVYYFHIGDEPVADENTDPIAIDQMRTKKMRMSGITPDDPALLKDIADEPQDIISVDFNKNGTLRNGAHVNQQEFEDLIKYTLKNCRRFYDSILDGDTSVSPTYGTNADACKYCGYADVCLKDRQIRGTDRRKLQSLKFTELLTYIKSEL